MPNPIPLNGKISIPNTSDLYGNIEYTKNLNLSKPGYIKLASRVAYMISQLSDANFGLPLSFGRKLNDQFYIATKNNSYIANTLISNFFIAADGGTNAPTATQQGFGYFFNNKWHVTDNGFIWVKDPSTGNWSKGGSPFAFSINGVSHMMESFPIINTAAGLFALAICDGNTVHVVDQTYSTAGFSSQQLGLPPEVEATAISYNNGEMGVATKLSSTNGSWQDGEAVFYTWDGQTNGFNGSFSVGSDTIICLKRYKTSWVLLTRKGLLLYFNGSGFQELCRLQFNYENRVWSDPLILKMFGGCINVEDDVININLPTMYNQSNKRGQTYIENIPGGVHIYDPKIGLYHRYAPSNSLSILLNVGVPSLVDGTFTSNQYLPATGNPIKYVNDPTNIIGGLVYNQVYYIIRIDSTRFKLAATQADAIAGNFIIPTSNGATTNSFLCVEVQDYGASYTTGNTGGIAQTGQHTVLHDHLLFGSELINGADNSVNGVCCVTIPGFKNIGYFVTSKMASANIKDILNYAITRFKPLSTGDGITVKVKYEDYVGLPVTSTQLNAVTTWVNNKTITTTANIVEAMNYLAFDTANELECEIIAGSGAGQMPQVVGIVPSGNSYIITLADTVDGAAAGNNCHFLINNWKKYDDISLTSVTDSFKKTSINKTSKWQKVKVILFGVDTTIETVQPLTKPVVLAE